MIRKASAESELAARSFRVLGVRINAVQIPEVVSVMETWIADRAGSKYIAVTGMHGVMEAHQSEYLRGVLAQADLVVPDGMPLVWLARWNHFDLPRRVYGPELMDKFCETTRSRYRHFFYGGAAGVAHRLAGVLQQKYGVQVAGVYCPPFRPLEQHEENEIFAAIQASRADVVWVGLSTPKQEAWMSRYKDRVGVPIMVGVGAAFDFLAGRTRQAPVWMREHGLEWSFRLLTEPRRLWRRYLVQGSIFLWNVGLEMAGLRDFS
jgi:N-acetylglucosaminyldiphosphoundecaprenol N-acetyl-beta-D-mannosaminyltransferase